jgi:universal stress protein E
MLIESMVNQRSLNMKRFKNILVVSGQAEATNLILERAVALAQRNGARLTLLEAVAGLPSGISTSVMEASSQEFIERFTLERHKHLIQQVSCNIESTMHLAVAVVVGTPFIEIIRAVLHNKHDLVMMASEEYGSLRGKLFGSTALHLMRKCPCPVWIMKPIHYKRFAGILAAVDPDPSDKSKHGLNIKIMDLATSLARQEQSKLHVVHVWSHWREPFLGYTTMPDQEVAQMTRELQAQRYRELDALIRGYLVKDLDSHIHFLEGDPGFAIPDLAASLHIELIVMGTVCRTGLPGLFIGNTAENVLGQVDCSVLTVKPEGFLSPVTLQDT